MIMAIIDRSIGVVEYWSAISQFQYSSTPTLQYFRILLYRIQDAISDKPMLITE